MRAAAMATQQKHKHRRAESSAGGGADSASNIWKLFLKEGGGEKKFSQSFDLKADKKEIFRGRIRDELHTITVSHGEDMDQTVNKQEENFPPARLL